MDYADTLRKGAGSGCRDGECRNFCNVGIWSVEYFDYFRCGRDGHALCQQDFRKVQGFAFVMLVSCLIHREVADAVAAPGLDMSVGDVLMDARMVKASKRASIWVAVNCKKKRARVFDALHTTFEVFPKAE